MMSSLRKRRLVHFSGVVQGVGFRPFIYRLARQQGLSGFVRNRPDGVVAEIEGTEEDLQAFIEALPAGFPPMADVAGMTIKDIPVCDDREFRIITSDVEGRLELHIAPDIATCPDCLTELFCETDRRYRYPFINCTNCGPRLTIIHDIPYDRINTSMSCFSMCQACQAEYDNPGDRRFHAEPNACPVCGPKLTLMDSQGRDLSADDPLADAVTMLRQGSILAIKGLGGFHLAVDAENDEAVRRLRLKKHREEKPLAIMVPDVDIARRFAEIGDQEEELLLSPQRPIVLLKKKEDANKLSQAIAPGMPNLGIMLPYTPIHHLLLRDHFGALVMTSGNQTDEPICIGNREALGRLQGIADAFLVHNRDILVRCDDSIATVVGEETAFLRRSRGYVPKPLRLNGRFPQVLALGPHLKSTLCLLKDERAFLSPHIGDLETPLARDFFHETRALLERITECHPLILACDLHPGYYATQAARQLADTAAGRMVLHHVQHHHAHIVSCMAENHLAGEVIGLAMDGTGYGTDGHIWGGEFLLADEKTFTRQGHLCEFVLPGGEKAIREPWRIAASLLHSVYGATCWARTADELRILPDGIQADVLDRIITRGINSPHTSSLGRLFDGVAVILGRRQPVTFEGQAAMELEGGAWEGKGDVLPYAILEGPALQIDWRPAIRVLAERKIGGCPVGPLIDSFHRTLASALTDATVMIRERTGLNRVALSGGCFQNRLLLELMRHHLTDAQFDVFCHHLVPTNDGGISLGQAVCAGRRAMTD